MHTNLIGVVVMYYKRQIEDVVKSAAKDYAAITLYGARQTGKSTMVRNLFPQMEYVTLDNTKELDLAMRDPELFLDSHSIPVIIDEIQKAPEIFESIKIRIDNAKLNNLRSDKRNELMYILTGSNQHQIKQKATESLAGRTAIIEVNSLSYCEKTKKKGAAFVPDVDVLRGKKGFVPKNRFEIFEQIFIGGMPEYYIKKMDRTMFFESYISTYLEKDVSKLINIDKLADFRRFLTVTALRTGQQIDYTDIGRNVGVDSRTAKSWMSILESSGIITLLQPYASNLAKRIVKTPKLYYMDTGLCAYLCGWSDSKMLEASSMSGEFFETYVVSEMIKSLKNAGKRVEYTLYYYRDRDQKEVDILYIKDQTIYPIEIKKGIGNMKADKNFHILQQYKMPIGTGLVIDTSDKLMPLNRDVYFCPVGLIGL